LRDTARLPNGLWFYKTTCLTPHHQAKPIASPSLRSVPLMRRFSTGLSGSAFRRDPLQRVRSRCFIDQLDVNPLAQRFRHSTVMASSQRYTTTTFRPAAVSPLTSGRPERRLCYSLACWSTASASFDPGWLH